MSDSSNLILLPDLQHPFESMKAVIAATVLAMVHSTCDSDFSCGEELTCAVQLPHPQDLSCEFPDFNAPCCDTFNLNVGCQDDYRGQRDCIAAGFRSLPSAEQAFFHSSGGMGGCTGLQQGMQNMQQYCTPAAGMDMKAATQTLVETMMETQFAIMTSQEPNDQSSFVAGMIGFVASVGVAWFKQTYFPASGPPASGPPASGGPASGGPASGELYSPLTEATEAAV